MFLICMNLSTLRFTEKNVLTSRSSEHKDEESL